MCHSAGALFVVIENDSGGRWAFATALSQAF
jgi:hypothetical protein